MTEYQSFIHKLSEGNIDRTFLNSDIEKAKDVSCEIFNKAQFSLRIFAGCLCAEFCNSVEYVEALSDFLERGGSLRILLNEYQPDYVKHSALFMRIAYFLSQGKSVDVRMTNAKPYFSNDPNKKPIHFMVGDEKAYRVEDDIENKHAFCNFNNPSYAESLILYFDKTFMDERTQSINLLDVFGYESK